MFPSQKVFFAMIFIVAAGLPVAACSVGRGAKTTPVFASLRLIPAAGNR